MQPRGYALLKRYFQFLFFISPTLQNFIEDGFPLISILRGDLGRGAFPRKRNYPQFPPSTILFYISFSLSRQSITQSRLHFEESFSMQTFGDTGVLVPQQTLVCWMLWTFYSILHKLFRRTSAEASNFLFNFAQTFLLCIIFTFDKRELHIYLLNRNC